MSEGPDEPLSILLLIPILGTGGAETQITHLAIGLAQGGHRVTVAAMVAATRDLEPLRGAGVRVVVLGTASRIEKALSLPRLIRLARQADVVHCGLWDVTLWGRLAALFARRPALVAEHTPGRAIERSLSSGADRARVIALHNRLLAPFTYAWVTCAQWQVGMLENEGVPAAKIVHVPNAVPVDEVREAARHGVDRAALDLPEDARVVVHVARLEHQKNQRGTLDAVATLREGLGDVRALIVGDGPDREELERHARRIGAHDWATFLGTRADVPALLALADLAVLPSSAEGLPMSLLEAIAAGTPVVATDVGDVRPVLERTGAGVVVPPGDRDAFVAACRRVLADDALHERLARAAWESRDFDAPPMVRAHERLFRGAVARERVPAAVGAPSLRR